MKTIHISHTDLDGYGCQFISGTQLKDIKYYNFDYGDFLKRIPYISLKEDDMLLITDINLNEEEAKYIDDKQKEIGFKLKLLDHHKTGEDQAKLYDWYHLDTTKCGTLLTYEFFYNLLENKDVIKKYETFVYTINDYDLWKEENALFYRGNLFNRIVFDNRKSFPFELEKEERKHIFSLLLNANKLLEGGLSIAETEFRMYDIERELFINKKDDKLYKTFHQIKVEYFTDKIMAKKPYTILKIDGYQTYLFTGLSKIFQIFSNKILHENEDIDIAINISNYGTMSIRSIREDIDLGILAKKYFNGGGHPQAAGGSLGLEKGEKLNTKELKEKFIERINEVNLKRNEKEED